MRKNLQPSTRGAAQKGFSLFEVILAVSILGVVTWAVAPAMKSVLTAKDNTRRAEQYATNQKIGNALLAWSAVATQDSNTGFSRIGTLPLPCTASPQFWGLTNNATCNADLTQFLLQQGVTAAQALNDGTTGKNLRVYQRVGNEQGLNQFIGLMYNSGPTVTLNYDFGVVYSTSCGTGQSCGNTSAKLVPSPLSAITDPGGSGFMVPDTAWAPPAFSNSNTADVNAIAGYGAVYVSTLPLQKQLLQSTATNIDNIRTALKSYYAINGNAYPSSGADSGGGAVGNAGCWKNWLNLTNSTTLLPQLGIGDPSFGVTAWGGTIEYCSDYDPTNAGKAVPPNYAALRIHRLAGQGGIPDAVTPANNVTISF